MEQAEMVTLLRAAVPNAGGVWADLGAGSGNFTRALAELIGAQGQIYAIDREAAPLQHQARPAGPATAAIQTQQADFTVPLGLPPLDGILIANALHFVRHQGAVLGLLARQLRPFGRIVIVEYDVQWPRPWIPMPVPFTRLQNLAAQAQLPAPSLTGTRLSPSSGMMMYSAVVQPMSI